MPRVSVIMSVYNGEKYLREAIDSILNQTFKDFEFIIVDDGSTDGTPKILKSYNDSRMHIITQGNKGIPQAKNRAIKASKGEYIAIIDADDIALPDRLQKQVEFLDVHSDVAVVGSDYYHIDENGRTLKRVCVFTEDAEIKKQICVEQCPFGHGFAMMRRNAVFEAGLYDEELKYAVEDSLWIRIAEKYEFASLRTPLVEFRMTAGQVSSAHKSEQNGYFKLAYKKNKKAVDELRRKYPNLSIGKPVRTNSNWCNRKGFANLYYDYAYALLFHKKPAVARKEITISLKYNPFKCKSHLLWLGTFLPLSFVEQVRKMKKLLMRDVIV